MKKWNLIIDAAKCNNCNNCVVSAKDEHIGNDYPGYAAPQPRQGHSWIWIERHVRGQAPMVDVTYTPKMCNHCDDAPCMKADGLMTGGGAAVCKRSDGLVIIDPVKAKGRRDLVAACPYGAIWWNEELQLPQIWIFDAHLLDQGWRQPRCVDVCPTGALEAIKVDDAAMAARRIADKLAPPPPQQGARPRVYYRNLEPLTKAFIGGTIYHNYNDADDCVEGAEVEVFRAGRPVARTTTDAFGDFKVDGLAPDGMRVELSISHPRYGQAVAEIMMAESVYLGPIALTQAARDHEAGDLN